LARNPLSHKFDPVLLIQYKTDTGQNPASEEAADLFHTHVRKYSVINQGRYISGSQTCRSPFWKTSFYIDKAEII